MKSLYLLLNIFTVIIPLIYSFHPRIRFSEYLKAFLPGLFITASIFIAWDIYFTRLGIWGFNEKYLLELNILNLPLEEVLFFICIPYACVFTYFSLTRFFSFSWPKHLEISILLTLSFTLLIIGLLNIDRSYTASTFIATSLLILIFRFAFRSQWFPGLLSSYALLLLPFFVINGILTGTGIPEPVVWYDNSENLGIRLLTIPVEDIIYGFCLIMINVFLFEKFKARIYPVPISKANKISKSKK